MDQTKIYTIVYIPDEEVFGIVTELGAHWSRVKYSKDGMTFEEVELPNSDIIEINQIAIGFEEE